MFSPGEMYPEYMTGAWAFKGLVEFFEERTHKITVRPSLPGPTHYSLPGLYWLVRSQLNIQHFWGKKKLQSLQQLFTRICCVVYLFSVNGKGTNISGGFI